MRHRAKLSIKQADDALVTGEQVRHVLRRQVVNREQVARNVDHFAQDAVARHVHAVIVARRQIGGGEAAVTEQVGHLIVAGQQGFQTVVMTFSLQDFIVLNGAKLADHAIGRHHQHVWIGIQRANVVAQRAHEEIVEGAISRGIRLLRLFHIDLVVFHEQIDDQLRQPTCAFARTPACEAGEPQFRQNVLQ